VVESWLKEDPLMSPWEAEGRKFSCARQLLYRYGISPVICNLIGSRIEAHVSRC
jgi:hypothetical protein